MTERLRVTDTEIEMAEMIGMSIEDYISARQQVKAEMPTIERLEEILRTHRKGRKLEDCDTDRAHDILIAMRNLGWTLSPASVPAAS